MSWIPVEFSLVRYSRVEGTHYFYDPAYPTAVQFLLNGQWESWDVGWVRYKAQDPDIKRIAQEAEARLIGDQAFAYTQWPSTPTEAVPRANERVPSPSNGESSTSAPPNHSQDQPLSPLSVGTSRGPDAPTPSYTSPYPTQAAPPTPTTNSAPPHSMTIAPLEDKSPTSSEGFDPPPNPASHHANLEPPLIIGEHLKPDMPAPPLPLTTNRETKILLSLDGDGVRGLSTVLLVESLVNAVCEKLDRRIDPYQIFDLMGGTSTGGILVILLGRLRMRAHRARDAYAQIARTMFKDKWNFFLSLDPHAPQPQYDGQALEKEIKESISRDVENQDELFFDGRPDSTNVFVVSTQVEIGSNRPALIRSYPTRRMAGPELDANLTTWQAMRATSAAPRYMEPHGGHTRRSVIEPGLVDYGTAKNNPIRDLVYECRKLYGYAHDTMVIISIGTGSGLDRMLEINEMANSVEDRTAEARNVREKFELESKNLIERGWMKYFRFNVPDLASIPLEEWSQVERVKEKTRAYLAKPDVGVKFYACVDTIIGTVMGDQMSAARGPGI